MFFGGKGGVGKTTCAAARAIASARAGARVLVVSTDPAHSLGDALGVGLSSRLTAISVRSTRSGPARSARTARGRGTLHAVELDAPRAFARWLARHRHALGDVLEHGTWLDRQDVDAVLDLPVPGVDELVGMVEIVNLARGTGRNDAFDEVVVDTAPTGHTLRLLNAPDTVAAVAEILDALQADHRLIREQFARQVRPEASDRLIELIAGLARDTGALLRDPARTRFEWVLLPEQLSIAESLDGLRALKTARMSVPEIIVNRVIPPGEACAICDRRRREEGLALARIRRTFGRGRRIRVIHAELEEPRGIAALARIGARLTGSPRARPRGGAPPAVRSGDTADSLKATRISAESIAALQGARLLFFGGKGGVGKTTTAAAVAVRLARADPSRRVLLLSTDPAHSLADVFSVPVDYSASTIRGAPANLFVRELDAPAALAARKAELESALVEIMTALGGQETGIASADRGVRELMNLAPPGIDELFAMLTVVEAQREYPLIIVDTAPTGHTLRLLEMPDAARTWVQVLLRVLLKYRSLVKPGQLASELVDLSKSIRALQRLMQDRDATRFIVVTRAAAVTRLETDRLMNRLRRLRLATPAVVINAVTLAPGRCPRCRAAAKGERRQLALLRQRCRRGCAIIQTPLVAPPPRGVRALDRWARTWILTRP